MTSPNRYVYGDFNICPLESDTPGHMRQACVVGAEKLVVQDVGRVRPPFRLVATWRAKSGSEEASARVNATTSWLERAAALTSAALCRSNSRFGQTFLDSRR
jgi:hypothetical protein